MSARLREVATMLGLNSHNLADTFWTTLYILYGGPFAQELGVETRAAVRTYFAAAIFPFLLPLVCLTSAMTVLAFCGA